MSSKNEREEGWLRLKEDNGETELKGDKTGRETTGMYLTEPMGNRDRRWPVGLVCNLLLIGGGTRALEGKV